jgi:hypothetical protein
MRIASPEPAIEEALNGGGLEFLSAWRRSHRPPDGDESIGFGSDEVLLLQAIDYTLSHPTDGITWLKNFMIGTFDSVDEFEASRGVPPGRRTKWLAGIDRENMQVIMPLVPEVKLCGQCKHSLAPGPGKTSRCALNSEVSLGSARRECAGDLWVFVGAVDKDQVKVTLHSNVIPDLLLGESVDKTIVYDVASADEGATWYRAFFVERSPDPPYDQ